MSQCVHQKSACISARLQCVTHHVCLRSPGHLFWAVTRSIKDEHIYFDLYEWVCVPVIPNADAAEQSSRDCQALSLVLVQVLSPVTAIINE